MLLFRPGKVVEYCDEPVCTGVCVHTHCISETTYPNFTKFSLLVGCSSVLLYHHVLAATN